MARIWDYRPVYENSIELGDLNYGIDFDSMYYFLESYFSQFEDSINLMEVLSTVIEDNELILVKNSNNKEQKSTEAKKAQKKSFKEKILKFIQSCKNAIINAFKFCVEKLSKFGAFIKRKAHEFKNMATIKFDIYMPPFKKKEFFNYSKDMDVVVGGVRAWINNDMAKSNKEPETWGDDTVHEHRVPWDHNFIEENIMDIFKKAFNFRSNEDLTGKDFAELFVRHYIDSTKEERVTMSLDDILNDNDRCMYAIGYNKDRATKTLNGYIKNCDEMVEKMGTDSDEFRRMKEYGNALSMAASYTSKSFTCCLRIYEWYFVYLQKAIQAINAAAEERMNKQGRNPDGTKKKKTTNTNSNNTSSNNSNSSNEKTTKESFGFAY